MATPSGKGVPLRSCNWISPRAVALVAKSNTYGSSGLRRGKPKPSGLVPNKGSRLPAGATQAWLGVMLMAISPARVSCSTSTHKAEKCTQWLTANKAMPLCLAFAINLGKPSAKAVVAAPSLASILMMAPCSWVTTGLAVASILPCFKVSMMPSKRHTP